jgi:exosortase A-associated hydrolase 1
MFCFTCADEDLIGITAVPKGGAPATGVLIIVGGPQYRIGSHRQFVLLSRTLAAHGIPCMRFDYRGMGDATGEQRDFETIDTDIRAAVDEFQARVPTLARVVLWGICDAATAACFYAAVDRRVVGVVLLNPWVRTEAGQAKTYLKHHYRRKLLNPQFWGRLLRGRIAVREALGGLVRALRSVHGSGPEVAATQPNADGLPSRTARALRASGSSILVVLSGRDYVASEFIEVTRDHSQWSKLLARATIERLDDADHTFSTAAWRDAVAERTARWVNQFR